MTCFRLSHLCFFIVWSFGYGAVARCIDFDVVPPIFCAEVKVIERVNHGITQSVDRVFISEAEDMLKNIYPHEFWMKRLRNNPVGTLRIWRHDRPSLREGQSVKILIVPICDDLKYDISGYPLWLRNTLEFFAPYDADFKYLSSYQYVDSDGNKKEVVCK